MDGMTWLELHAAVTHFPIALVLAGAAFEAAGVFLRRDEWKRTAAHLFIAGAAMAVPAAITGWIAANALYRQPSGWPDLLLDHRNVGIAATLLATLEALRRLRARESAVTRPRLGSLAVAALVGYAGYLGGQMTLGARGNAAPTPAPVVQEAEAPELPAPELVARGEVVFRSDEQGCLGCHSYQGEGGKVGPDLTRAGVTRPDVSWHIAHLKNPASLVPGSTMPRYDSLPEPEIEALAAFLASRGREGSY